MRRKLRMEKRNRKRATVMVTSGGMTFLVDAETLVTSSFLMSPTIERTLSVNCVTVFSLINCVFIAY